jgi:probable addiction module antidote protein
MPQARGNIMADRSVPKTTKLDPKTYRDNPDAIARYLTESFDKNDLSEILRAIQSVMQAQNVQQLSEITGLRRDNLYRTFRGEADPLFSRVLTVLAGLDVRFVLQALPAREKPTRSKRGRPPSSKAMSRLAKARKRQRNIERRSSPRPDV